MSKCVIEPFKKEFNMEGSVLRLNTLSFQQRNDAHRMASSINNAIKQEGFDIFNDLIKFESNNNIGPGRFEINTEMLDRYNTFIRTKQVEEEIKNNNLADNESIGDILDEKDVSDNLSNLPLFSPAPLGFKKVSNSKNPTTPKEWRDNRIELYEKLEKEYHNAAILKDREKQKQIELFMDEVKNQIDSIKLDSLESVYDTVMEDIANLKDFMSEVKADPKNAKDSVNVINLEKRIMILQNMFMGIDFDSGKPFDEVEYDSPEYPSVKFYHSFMKDYGTQNTEAMKILKAEVQGLHNQFRNLRATIIQNIAETDILVEHNVRTKEYTDEDINTITSAIKNGKVEIQKINQFVGLERAGVIGQLLDNSIQVARAREVGVTQERFLRLHKNYIRLNDKKIKGTSFPLSSLLFGRDKFGVRKGLISKYSEKFLNNRNLLYEARKSFFGNTNSTTYANWMQLEKSTSHRIDVRKLKVGKEAFGNHAEFGSHFNFTEDEVNAYEKELIDSIGETMFRIESKKAVEAAKNYVETYDNGGFTSRTVSEIKNPFLFLQNFNSDNYDKIGPAGFFNPVFTVSVPKLGDKTLINEKFTEVENHEYGKDLMEIYEDIYSLVADYINPTFRAEGAFIGNMGLMDLDDSMQNQLMHELNIFGKVRQATMAMFDSWTGKYFNKGLASLRNNNTKYGDNANTRDEVKRRLNVSVSANLRTDFLNTFRNKSVRELESLMEKNGYNIPQVDLQFMNPVDIENYKDELAKALTQDAINKRSSMNLLDIVQHSVELAQNINIRNSVRPTYDMVKNYVKDSEIHNLSKYLDDWEKGNLDADTLHKDKGTVGKNNELETSGKILSFNFGGYIKKYTPIERDLKKTLNEERKNFNKTGKYNFKYEGNTYEGDSTGYYERDEDGNFRKISQKEIEDIYENYFSEKMKRLGTELTLGSSLEGFSSSIAVKFLSISVNSGFGNREQGIKQNMTLGATGDYGYSRKDYNVAKAFMMGANSLKYFKGIFEKTERGKNHQTTKLLLEQLQLLQNVAKDLVLESKPGIVKKFKGLEEFIMDFSINNPEWKNQGEIALAILMNVKVESNELDENGNKISKPVFDGKNFIYEPGTLKLRPEFRTPENIKNWENFTEVKNEEGQIENPAVVATIKINKAVKATSGNYSKTDVPPAQHSMWGKVFHMFKKYLPAMYDTNFGKESINLAQGKMDIKGRKIVLLEHAPTTMVYLALNQNKILWGGIGTVMAGGLGVFTLPALAVGGGLFAISLGIAARKGAFNKMRKLSFKEVKLAWDFAKETFFATVYTVSSTRTYNKVRLFENKVNNWNTQEKADRLGLTLQDKKKLSEASQELASKLNTCFIYNIMGIAITQAVSLLFKPGDDEDDEVKQAWFDQFMNREKIMNHFINQRNNITQDDALMSGDVISALENFSTPVLIGEIQRTGKFLEDFSSVMAGEKPMDDNFKYKSLTLNPFLRVPNSFARTIVGNKSNFQDDRVYDKMSWLDKNILRAGVVPSEKAWQTKIRDSREILKIKVEDKYKDIIRKEWKEEGRDFTSFEVGLEAEERTKEFMKKTHKDRNDASYEELYNRIDWDGLIDEVQ